MIKPLKTLILLLLCVAVANTSCKKKKTTPAAPTFDQLSLADIKAQDAAFSDPANTGAIFYNDPTEMRTFKVGSILFLKNPAPTLHYAKLEILSVSGTQLVFNYMAYSDTGAEMVSKKEVTITAGIDDFASWTGLHNADASTCSIFLRSNPKIFINSNTAYLLVAQP
jgi:hypothetical protein